MPVLFCSHRSSWLGGLCGPAQKAVGPGRYLDQRIRLVGLLSTQFDGYYFSRLFIPTFGDAASSALSKYGLHWDGGAIFNSLR